MGLLPQNTENKNKFLKKREAWFYILYCENVFTKGQNAGDPMLQVVPPGVAEGFLCTTEVAERSCGHGPPFMPAQPCWTHAHYSRKWMSFGFSWSIGVYATYPWPLLRFYHYVNKEIDPLQLQTSLKQSWSEWDGDLLTHTPVLDWILVFGYQHTDSLVKW